MIIQYGTSSYVLAVSQGDDRLSPSAAPSLLTILIYIIAINNIEIARGKRRNNNASTQRIKLLITMDNSFLAAFSILITNRLIGHAYAIDKNDNMVIFLFIFSIAARSKYFTYLSL